MSLLNNDYTRSYDLKEPSVEAHAVVLSFHGLCLANFPLSNDVRLEKFVIRIIKETELCFWAKVSRASES